MSEQVSGLKAKLEQRSERLIRELQAARQSLIAIEQELEDALATTPLFVEKGRKYEDALRQVRAAGNELSTKPLNAYQRQVPVKRMLAAVEEFWRSAAEIASTDALGSRAEEAAWRAAISASEDSGQLLLATTRGVRALIDPWNAVRGEALRVASGALEKRGAALAAIDHWKQWRRKRDADTGKRLESLQRKLTVEVGRIVSDAFKEAAHRPVTEDRAEFEENLDFWRKRQRALAEEMRLEQQLRDANGRLIETALDAVQAIDFEKQALLELAEQSIRYLSQYLPGMGAYEPPEARIEMATLEQRVSRWERESFRALQEFLPEELVISEPNSALPTWRNEWRTIRPKRTYEASLRESAKPALSAALERMMEGSALLLREIEHAREVMSYGLECAASGGVSLLDEARTNAVALLREAKEQSRAADPEVRETALRGLIGALWDAGQKMEMGRSSLLAAITKRRGQVYLEAARNTARSTLAAVIPAVETRVEEAIDRLLVAVGWRLPPPIEMSAVETRATLAGMSANDRRARDLPGIYRRLFAFAPVVDPRYLVGREDALEGLQSCLAEWRAGRYGACVLVGARGSGKTSLLNCAMKTLLSDEDVVFTSFSERVRNHEQAEAFLRVALRLPEGAALEDELRSRRRVIVIEELERSYLKAFGGFDGLKRLMLLVQSSGRETLWILSINNRAFEYLDAAVGLGRVFARRVNAMRVPQESLERAILQRHSLSGLRLKFLPPAKHSHLALRDREKDDPQGAFFEALHRESGGVFRSAFEMWLNSIESAEGGEVTIRQPEDPNYEPVHRELNRMDRFTLLSLQQHGSLTADELAESLFEPLAISRGRMERLEAMGLLDKDPRFPGVRVIPEAHRLVESALMRENLT